MLRDFLLYLVGFFALLAVVYTAVRVGSIAHYKTRVEYHRLLRRIRPVNGEHDAEK